MTAMRSHRRTLVALALLATALVATVALPATAVPPPQTFATFSTATSGTLDGTAFSVGGCESASSGTSDLSGPAFAPAGSATQATTACTTATGLSVTLVEARDGLDLYLADLPYAHCADGVYTITTDGAGPITIASGFDTSTLVGSTLTVPFDSASSGVLHLGGPVSTVTLVSAAGAFTATLTLGTAHVEPTTTTTVVVPGPDVAGATAGAVTPAFTC
jgi:hypothetical protein